jgi:hypothetical protein
VGSLEVDDVVALADLYRLKASERAELLSLAKEAWEPSGADALAWITLHRLPAHSTAGSIRGLRRYGPDAH